MSKGTKTKQSPVVSAELTSGMSSIEVWIVMLSSAASKSELRRLADFFAEYSK